MRVVNQSPDDPNVVDLNFMWLPTFIGQNPVVLKELQKHITTHFVGKQVTDETLWAMHNMIVSWLEAKFPFEGIGKYLRAIEEVKDDQ